MIAKFIGVAVTFIVGLSLIPKISEQVNNAALNSSQTSLASLGFVIPFIFGVAILTLAIAMTFSALKSTNNFSDGVNKNYDYVAERKQNNKVETKKDKVDTREYKSNLKLEASRFE